MKLQKHVFALGAALFLVATSQLSALTMGDANYLGYVNDGIPANPVNEVSYINWLTSLGAGALPVALPNSEGEIYSRIDSTIAGPFPTAILDGSFKTEEGAANFSLTVNATGYAYILGKYDAGKAGSMVWYFPGGAAGNVTLPDSFNGHDISHISLYNGRTTSVPDGGTTAMLLGLALSGIAMIRRYIS